MDWGKWLTITMGMVQTVFTVLAYYKKDGYWKTSGYRMTPLFKMALLSAATWALIGYDLYDRRYAAVIDIPAIHDYFVNFTSYHNEYSMPYIHQTVKLDGLRCNQCSFNDVTLQWDGTAPFDLRDVRLIPGPQGLLNIRLQSDNLIVTGTLELVHRLGGTIPNYEITPRPWPPSR